MAHYTVYHMLVTHKIFQIPSSLLTFYTDQILLFFLTASSVHHVKSAAFCGSSLCMLKSQDSTHSARGHICIRCQKCTVVSENCYNSHVLGLQLQGQINQGQDQGYQANHSVLTEVMCTVASL